MWTASASSASRWESSYVNGFMGLSGSAVAVRDVQAALGLVEAGPATFATLAGPRAGRAADRGVAPVVQRVIRQVVGEDVAPEVLLGPVRQRVDLPDPALLVAFDLRRGGSGRRLLAANAGDPGIDALERALERVHLGLAAAALERPRLVRAAGVHHLDVHPEAVLEALPGGQSLGEQHAGVDREYPGIRAGLSE